MDQRPNGDVRRVRIGLTGLAFVFILVLLAAVFTKASDEEPITANRIEEAATGGAIGTTNATADETNEPLADLGVAPGGAPEAENKASADTVPVEDPLRPRRRR